MFKKVYRFFLNRKKEEVWLNEMAKSGLQRSHRTSRY